jgi:catalase
MHISVRKIITSHIGAAALIFGAAHVSYAADAAPAADKPVTEQLVDTLTQLAQGPHLGYRANHAKGIMVSGTFVPAAGAAGLSKAAHLQQSSTPVLVRFSDATGVPAIPDADPNANPRGMAIRFQLPKDASTDIVAISINGFPAATPEEFLAFLQAVAASGPGAPKPSPVEQFLATHPATLKFVTPKPAPMSFATQAFYGVNAFKFTNAKGESRYGRYRIVPLAGEHALSDEQAAKAEPDYLREELRARLKQGPIKFRLSVQLAEAGDATDDGTAVWPDSRPQVELGVLTLNSVLPSSEESERSAMFSPLNLVDGIDGSNDPILNARPAAYAISYGRRLGN